MKGSLMKKPRVNFCWECGRKLQGRHHKEIEIHGCKRILHKSCAKIYEKPIQSTKTK